MLKLIEHIAIAASDPASLARWYCDTLGFTMLVAAADSQTYFVGLPGGGILEIIPVAPQAKMDPVTHNIGIHHIAFAVADFAAAYQGLQAKGIQFIGPHYEAPDGGTSLDFFIDPEGNRLQLVYRRQALGA